MSEWKKTVFFNFNHRKPIAGVTESQKAALKQNICQYQKKKKFPQVVISLTSDCSLNEDSSVYSILSPFFLSFFFFAVVGLELRAYTLSHSFL
jgi:hypothetical protein